MSKIQSFQVSNSQIKPHSLIAKVFHWGFAAVFIFALTKQLDEVDELESFSLLQYEMAFACFFLTLLVVRFLFMRATRPTALQSDTPTYLRRLTRAGHLGMYVSLSLIAISGLAIGGLYWSGVKSGGAMEVVLGVHEVAINTSFFLIIGHVAAAVFHRLKGDGIWSAMVPVWKEFKDE